MIEMKKSYVIYSIAQATITLVLVVLTLVHVLSGIGFFLSFFLFVLFPSAFVVTVYFLRREKKVDLSSRPYIEIVKEINELAKQEQQPEIDITARKRWTHSWKTFYPPDRSEPFVMWAVLAPKVGSGKKGFGLWRYDATHKRIDFDNSPNFSLIESYGLWVNYSPFQTWDESSRRKDNTFGRSGTDVNVNFGQDPWGDSVHGQETKQDRKKWHS